jgi:[calcium/calmodulin-dependent protein kinase] kinase
MMSSHERTFEEGSVIMRQGDQGTYLMYIVEGTVDVLVKWFTTPPRRSAPTSRE